MQAQYKNIDGSFSNVEILERENDLVYVKEGTLYYWCKSSDLMEEEKTILEWKQHGNIFTAASDSIRYKIEKLEKVTQFYYEGSKQKRKTYPVLYSVLCQDIGSDFWHTLGNYTTLNEAKNKCIEYETI